MFVPQQNQGIATTMNAFGSTQRNACCCLRSLIFTNYNGPCSMTICLFHLSRVCWDALLSYASLADYMQLVSLLTVVFKRTLSCNSRVALSKLSVKFRQN